MNEKATQVYHYHYINNAVSSLVNGFAEYLRYELFPRSTDIIVSTYEKAIEHYRNKANNAGHNHSPKFPFISLDPVLDFEPDGSIGKLFTGYPNFELNLASKLHSPDIYKDDNVTISPILNRYRGTMEVSVWCSSIYEYIDYRMLVLQAFGGLGRPIYPKNIYGYFIVPDEVQYYDYHNVFTGESYSLDWDTNDAQTILVKNINKNKMCWPFTIRPFFTLSSISAANDPYGGTGDELSDHRLVLTIEWESAIPTHLVLTAMSLPEICHKVNLDIVVSYKWFPGEEDRLLKAVPDEIIRLYSNDETNLMENKDLIYNKYYNYILEDSHIETFTNDENLEIELSDPVDDCIYIDIYSKYGRLRRDFQWKLDTENNKLILFGVNLKTLRTDDILKIIYYKVYNDN